MRGQRSSLSLVVVVALGASACTDPPPPPCPAGCVEGACVSSVEVPPGPPPTDPVLWADHWRSWCEPREGEDPIRPEVFECRNDEGALVHRERYHYDDGRRVVRIDHFSHPNDLDTVTAHLEIEWGDDGRVARVTHIHDAVMDEISWIHTFSYERDRLHRIVNEDGAIRVEHTLGYDDEGRVREHVEDRDDPRADGDSTTYVRTWDEAGRPTSLEALSPDGERLWIERYEHDTEGRFVRQLDETGDGALQSSRVLRYDRDGTLIRVEEDHDGDLVADASSAVSDECCGFWCAP